MSYLKKLALATVAIGAIGTGGSVTAQSTDGNHTIQIFPVVVDSTTFTQRFIFRNPVDASGTVTIAPTFFPGEGTAQAAVGPVSCPSFTVPAGQAVTKTSLRAMCPALVSGSAFGYLYTYETDAANRPYAGFSRVSNFAGNGFSVEAVPASAFNNGDGTKVSAVTGLRRLAATGSTPAYQTNCFIGNLNEITGPATGAATVNYYVATAGNSIFAQNSVVVAPGKFVRLLDVFASAGAAAGNYDDAQAFFWNTTNNSPIMAFCTVQDNTSFGADFRIAKPYRPAPRDGHVQRETSTSADSLGRAFTSDVPNSGYTNNHIINFKHPDWVQCELIDPNTGTRAAASYGLEMRMRDTAGNVIAGGDNQTGFGEIYLGDKVDRYSGSNGTYLIDVEVNGQQGSAAIPYRLHCQSGSGHTIPEIAIYHSSVDAF